jgi:D-sedoheptulose 7-phosphate isomerase
MSKKELDVLGISSRTDATKYLEGLKTVLDTLSLDDLDAVIECLHAAYVRGSQVFIVGNGGSASTASHMACDLGKTVLRKAPDAYAKRFRVIALTDNVALLTAWANDASYSTVFAEQLRNVAVPGDVLIAISASGSSPNITQAISAARQLDMTSIALLGFDGGVCKSLADLCLVVDSTSYGYVEDAHLILNHLIASHLQNRLFE